MALKNPTAFVANRLREPTTWAGIFVMLQEVGVVIAPEYAEQFRTVGIALASLVIMFMKEGRAND